MANNIPFIACGDTLEMKKAHPCGSKFFKVVRVGSEVRVICESCSRDLTVERVKLEKMIKKIHHTGNNGTENEKGD